jgi:hypothetical protein
MTPPMKLAGSNADCKKNTNNLKTMEAIGKAGKPFVFYGALSLALHHNTYYRCHNDIDTLILKEDKDWWVDYIKNLDLDFRIKINVYEFEKDLDFWIPSKPILYERVKEDRPHFLNKKDYVVVDVSLKHSLEEHENFYTKTIKVNDQDIKIMNPDFLKLTKIRRMQFWDNDIKQSEKLLNEAIESNQINEAEIAEIKKIIQDQKDMRRETDKKDIFDIKNYFNIDIDIDNIQNM